MAPNKVRLDLMVNESTKEFLQEFARDNGVSMSEMVDRLIVEHLINEGGHVDESKRSMSAATMDALRMAELQDAVKEAISDGSICSFEQYCETEKGHSGAHAHCLVYSPSKWDCYAEIVADMCVDEIHDDIISTYSDLFQTVDVYLSWYEDTDGHHLMGLCVVPKGGNPTSAIDNYDWDANVTWPDGKPEPQCIWSE